MSYEEAVIRVGNKGTIIDITVYEVTGSNQSAVNLAQTNSQQMEFKRRNGSTQIVTASIKNSPGSDGVITYTDSAGTVFNHSNATKGTWEVRGIVNYASGNTFKGSWQGFTVGD
jgi:hypothetical protein